MLWYGRWLYSRTFLCNFGSAFQFACPPLPTPLVPRVLHYQCSLITVIPILYNNYFLYTLNGVFIEIIIIIIIIIFRWSVAAR